MDNYTNNNSYVGKRVKIINSNKTMYGKIIGKTGTITINSSGSIGVTIDGYYNYASNYGVYWFDKKDLKFLNNESEDNTMDGFKYVAIVNLLDDYNKKDYAFALHEDDYLGLTTFENANDVLVVVNARAKNNRLLATVKEIMLAEDYKATKITAEVVGIVNMYNYNAREAEKERLSELAKKKAAIEMELEKEINKRKSVEYYEEMAKKYSDNPRLAELVGELRGLGT